MFPAAVWGLAVSALLTPDAAERAHDEQQLAMLNCWDDPGFYWSAGDIARALGVTRSTVLGVVHRVHKADACALTRRPQSMRGAA